MAEERVILQVKFDQIRSAGSVGSVIGPASGFSASKPIMAEVVRVPPVRVPPVQRPTDQASTIASADLGRNAASRVGAIIGRGAASRVGALLGSAGGPVGIVAGTAIGTIVGHLGEKALQDTMDAFRAAVKRVTEELRKMTENAQHWSRVVGGQALVADRRRLLAERRQAFTLENELASLVRARSVIDAAVIDIKTSIGQVLLPKLIPAVEAYAGLVSLIAKGMQAFASFASSDWFTGADQWLQDQLRPFIGELANGLEIHEIVSVSKIARKVMMNMLRQQVNFDLEPLENAFDRLADASLFRPPNPGMWAPPLQPLRREQP